MRRLVGFVIVLVLTIRTSSVSLPQEKPTNREVYFSPNEGCTDAVVRELVKAQNNVLVQAYSFTLIGCSLTIADFNQISSVWVNCRYG